MGKIAIYLNHLSSACECRFAKIIAVIGSGIIATSLFISTNMAYMNSDNSFYALSGRDIAEGNILLNGWIGSTISHYFPYITIEAFWAIFFHNNQVVHALSIVSLSFLFACVLYFTIKGLLGEKPNIFIILSLIVIFTSIRSDVLTDSFAHLAPMLCAIVAAYLYYCERDKKWAKWLIVALLFSWIDNYNLVYFLIPIILENIIYAISEKKLDPMLKWVALGMVCCALRVVIFKDFGMVVPGADNIISSAATITNLEDLEHRLLLVYESLNVLFSSNFWGRRIDAAFFGILFSCFLLLAIILKYRYSVIALRGRYSEKNRFLSFFLIGSILIIGIQLFTKMSIGSRYLIGFYVNSLVIVGYWVGVKGICANRNTVVFIIVLLFSISYQINQKRYEIDHNLKARQAIVSLIHNEGLHSGFSWFGNALSTNFLLNEKRVATLGYKSTQPMLWMIDKKSFYPKEKFDFVLSWKDANTGEWGMYDLDDQAILHHFGSPKKTIDIDRFRIYIYEDISDKVDKSNLN
jgi:hypothetical protein